MQSVLFGTHPTTGVPQFIKTDGNNNLQFTPTAGNVALRAAVDNADAVAVSAVANAQVVASRTTLFNGTTWDRARGDLFGAYEVPVGSSAAAAGLTPIVSQGTFSQVLKVTAGNLYSATCLAGATAGYLVAYNAIAAPGNAVALTAALVLDAVAVPANGSASLNIGAIATRFSVGITLIFTTSLVTQTNPANAALLLQGKFV